MVGLFRVVLWPSLQVNEDRSVEIRKGRSPFVPHCDTWGFLLILLKM